MLRLSRYDLTGFEWRVIVLADKAYDADRIRALIEEQGATPNIPAKSNRKWKPCLSKRLYRKRGSETWVSTPT